MVLYSDVVKCTCDHAIVFVQRQQPSGAPGWVHLDLARPAIADCPREPGPQATPAVEA